MQQIMIAKLAGVNQADVSNNEYGRGRFVSAEKKRKIEAVKAMSKTQAVLVWLSRGNTLTPIESLNWFGLHALSQTITKLRRRGHDIRNLTEQPNQSFAVYALFVNGVRV